MDYYELLENHIPEDADIVLAYFEKFYVCRLQRTSMFPHSHNPTICSLQVESLKGELRFTEQRSKQLMAGGNPPPRKNKHEG